MADLVIGSLFSGIDGLSLGLERAGLGPTVFQVERSAFCRHVLARHWPNAERFTDVRAVSGASLPRVDVLCGGFPCQQVSSAGGGEGIGTRDAPTDRSGLWWEFDRLIGEILPRWVVVENVASGARRWLPSVRRCLWERGYASLPIRVRACDVGARHIRARIFVVGGSPADIDRLTDCYLQAVADADDRRELQPEGGEREQRGRAGDGASPDSHRPGLPDGERQRRDAREAPGKAAERDPGAISPGFGLPARPWVVRGVHGLPGGLDGPWKQAGWTGARLRTARIHALGNSVVSAQAEPIGRLIVAASS